MKFGAFLSMLRPYVSKRTYSNKEYIDYFINLFIKNNDWDESDDEILHKYSNITDSFASQLLNGKKNIDKNYAIFLQSNFSGEEFMKIINNLNDEQTDSLYRLCKKNKLKIDEKNIDFDLVNTYSAILNDIATKKSDGKNKETIEYDTTNDKSNAKNTQNNATRQIINLGKYYEHIDVYNESDEE